MPFAAPARPLLLLAAILAGGLLPAAAPSAQEESWTRLLPGLAPALVACLQGEAGAAVTAALPMTRGRALVRLARPDGERLECIAELAPPGQPAKRESRGPAGPMPPLPGEGEQRFTLAQACPAARPVQAADGPVLGWLAPEGCR